MKIKRLEIQGFKSFLEKTALNFEDGITGIVGPNGCGKSNIVDAILWVMGEQSAKHLRGSSMEDVIFNGSDDHPPTGMAEVSMILSNPTTPVIASKEGDGGLAPSPSFAEQSPPGFLKYSEIMVTRRLYRSGESEYLINKTTCRLRDILDLFMDTGVGTKAYSIIEQGQISKMISAKPEDRRTIIEEAAGVTKYKVRKKESLRKIEITQQNLLRINDIILELEKQLKYLQRQAKKASAYKEVKDRAKFLDLVLASKKFDLLVQDRDSQQRSFQELQQQQTEAKTKYQSLEAQIEERRVRLIDEERRLSQLQQQVYEFEGEIQRKEQTKALREQELKSLDHLKVRAQTEVELLQQRLISSRQGQKAIAEQEVNLTKDYAEKSSELQNHEAQLNQLREQQFQLEKDLEKKKTEVIEAIAELNRAKQAMEHYKDRLNAIQQRNNILDGERKEKASLLEVEVQEIQGIKNYIANKTAQKSAIQSNQEDLQDRVTSLQQRLEDLDSEVDSTKDALTQARSTIKSLQEFKKQFEGYESGVRELMLREGSSDKYTLLTDLFEVERGFEKALEAACAQRLQEIVVESPEEALEAIKFLHEGNKGRGSFLPKIWYTTSPSSQPALGLQPLASRVRLLDEKLKGIIEAMLQNIYIIDSLENAFSYRQKLPSGTILVTREGDLFKVDGVIAGGSEDPFAHQVVTKQKELQGLQEEERKQESQYLETTKRLDDVQRELQEAEEQLEDLYNETHQVEIDLVDFKGKLDQRERHQQQLQTRLNEIDTDIKQLTEEGDRINMSLAEARIRMTDSESIRQAGEKGIEEYQRDLAKFKEDVIQQAYLVTDLKVTVASLSERRTHLNSELAKTDDVCKEIESKMSQHQMEVGDSDRKRVELSQEIETTKQQLLNFIKDHEEAKRQLSTARSRFEEAMAELRKFEEGSKDTRSTYEEAVEKVNHATLRLQELRMEIQRLEEQMQDRYFINLHQIYEGYKLEEVNQLDADQELEILKNRLHRMGEVNTSAIEEYDEVQKRHQFLLTQRDDLSESVERLKKTIEKINRVSRQRFEAAFHAVNDKFQKVFPMLFGGGKAELILTEPDNLLESGVEIFAKPPGKKLQNINLLSGGEKALTAVSLIFSIFLIKPSPFCLLDEVDAPLDDANIGRFNEMVGQMANMSQFILITHNKRTMEIADVLYGVTMEQPGVSKLVSVVLSDAHRMVQPEAHA